MSFVVVYDACVLYPAPLRDLLLETLASQGLPVTADLLKEFSELI